MLKKSMYLILGVTFLLSSTSALAEEVVPEPAKRVGIVVFADQPLFDQAAFTSIEKSMQKELDDYYDVAIELVPLPFNYEVFLNGFSAEYESYILAVMEMHSVDYLIFGEILIDEKRVVINCFSNSGEQLPIYLPYSKMVKSKFNQLAPGFYLNAVNVFSSDIGKGRLY